MQSLWNKGLFGGGWTSSILGETSDPFNLAVQEFRPWSGPVPPIPQVHIDSAQSSGRIANPLEEVLGSSMGKRRTWAEEDSRSRAKAVREWYELFLRLVPASPLAAQLREDVEEADAIRTLEDTLRSKSTGTLQKRLTSLLQYESWKGVADPKRQPLEEASCYRYVCALVDEGAAATRGQSFVDAVRFVFGLSGLQERIQVVISGRCEGASQQLLSRKRSLTKRSPLTASQVAEMELYVTGDGDERQRVVARSFLYMVHARLRLSEVVRLQEEPELDVVDGVGFIEAQTVSDVIKSGQTKRRRGFKVPLVGIATGLLGLPWAQAWLDLRKKHGLRADLQGTLFPRLTRAGWATGSPSCAEANAWLGAFMSNCGPAKNELQLVGTHSCKATLLSWCWKFGVKGELRRLLGGHSKPKERTMLEYSRDALAGPLDALANVLSEVREGTFDPDATRSGKRGHFGRLADRVGGGRVLGETFSHVAPLAAEDDGSDEIVSLSSEATLVSDDEGKGAHFLSEEGKSALEGLGEGSALWAGTKSGILHCKSDNKADRMYCGVASVTAEPATCGFHEWVGPVCKKCFREGRER